jgi:hypothetical protein
MGVSWGTQLPPAVRKTHRALLPLFIALVCFSYIDRTSLAFAALQLCEQPWFNARVYGLVRLPVHESSMRQSRSGCCLSQITDEVPFFAQGSGIFYAGYVTSQIPSNLLLARFGARTWLPLITAVHVPATMLPAASSPFSM